MFKKIFKDILDLFLFAMFTAVKGRTEWMNHIHKAFPMRVNFPYDFLPVTVLNSEVSPFCTCILCIQPDAL